MKKLTAFILSLLTVLSLALVSCGSDIGDNDNLPENDDPALEMPADPSDKENSDNDGNGSSDNTDPGESKPEGTAPDEPSPDESKPEGTAPDEPSPGESKPDESTPLEPEADKNIPFTYTVNIKTEGGMVLSGLAAAVYEYKNGEPGEMVDYGTTDAEGIFSFEIAGNAADYAVDISIALPGGYTAEPFYVLDGETLDIAVKTGVYGSYAYGDKLTVGEQMKELTINNINGAGMKLSEILAEKKAVILNFWFIDCTWCDMEFPFIEGVYSSGEYSNDIAFIALNVNANDSPEEIKAYAESKGLSFDLAIDYYGLSSAFDAPGYPTSVVIDRYGMVSMIHIGALLSEEDVKKIFDHYTADDYRQEIIKKLSDIE